MTRHLPQDPDELFDVITEDGEPTGITKRREDVHRDGDWHRAIHVWVYGIGEQSPYLLLNQRGRHKDTWPLALDVTVGGHLAAGETVEQAYREIEEEIGITPDPAALQHIGRRARASNGDLPGIIDREIQEIFLLRDDRPMAGFRPNPAELEGLVQVKLEDGLPLFAGEADIVPATRLVAGTGDIEQVSIRYDELLFLPDDDYFRRVARAIQAAINGEANVTI